MVDIDKFFINNEKVGMLGFSMYAISGKVFDYKQTIYVIFVVLHFNMGWFEKILQQIHVLLRNYLGVQNEHVARNRVKWREWYLTHRKHW